MTQQQTTNLFLLGGFALVVYIMYKSTLSRKIQEA
jgi:hypothetical protein